MANEVALKKKENKAVAEKKDSKAIAKKDNKAIAKKDAKKPAKKNDGKNAKKRRGPIRYIKDVFQELKKVTWPTRKELVKATLAVLAFVAAFTLVIWLMDLALTPVFKWLVG